MIIIEPIIGFIIPIGLLSFKWSYFNPLKAMVILLLLITLMVITAKIKRV